MDKKIANKMLNSHIIYCHKNLLNNKLYFGITSLKPIERWGSKGQGYKNNKHFNRAIKYYGWDSFEHIIVKEGLPEACAKTLERILIYKYNTTNPNNGYNLTEGGEGVLGWHHSEITKEKMSLNAKGVNNNFYGKYHTKDSKQKMRLARLGKSPANKGTSLSEEAKLAISEQRCKEVVQYDLDGNIINTYKSSKEAGEINNFYSSNITRACRTGKSYKNFNWQYKYGTNGF